MIPARFVPLAELPLTRSGKVDLQALPAPGQSRPHLAASLVGPRNPLEHRIASIWQEVLDLDQVGIYDNFFELGGHSLLATQMISRLRAAFRVDVSFRTLFDAPTVAGIAAAIVAALTQRAANEPGPPSVTRTRWVCKAVRITLLPNRRLAGGA